MKNIKDFLSDIHIEDPVIMEIVEDTFNKVYEERKKISGNKAFYSARAAALAKIAYIYAKEVI